MNQEPTTLYHYCRTEVFHSIVNARAFWLSSLTQSNDALEGKLLSTLLDDVSNEMDLTPAAKDALGESFKETEQSVNAVGICLSSDGDVLSQWRAYAGDGSGVSIGFNREYLEWRRMQVDIRSGTPSKASPILRPVIYDGAEQKRQLLPLVEHLRELLDAQWSEGRSPFRPILSWETSARKIVYDAMQSLTELLFLLKGYAFREEQEWRMFIPVLDWFPPEGMKYRAAGTQLCPYRPVDLPQVEGLKVIDRVVLGPKHRTPDFIMESFLRLNGFEGVEVLRSQASYQ